MSETTLKLTPTGQTHPQSQGHEVILLGLRGSGIAPLQARDGLTCDGWDVMRDIAAGPELGRVPLGLRGQRGTLELDFSARGRLAFLTHPWSGRVKIELGSRSAEIDLYSPETAAIFVDIPEGSISPADAAAFKRMKIQAHTPAQPGIMRAAPADVREGELLIRATGESTEYSASSEVIVLQIEPYGYGVATDLTHYAREDQSWATDNDVMAGDRVWTGCLKTTCGELRTPCDPSAKLYLLRHAWSGVVEISYGNSSVAIDLYAPKPAVLELCLNELQFLQGESGADFLEKSPGAAPATPVQGGFSAPPDGPAMNGSAPVSTPPDRSPCTSRAGTGWPPRPRPSSIRCCPSPKTQPRTRTISPAMTSRNMPGSWWTPAAAIS